MADAKNKSFVWRGTASDTLSDKPEKNQKKLDKVHPVKVAQGEKQKIQGVVSIRSGDSFKVRDPWRRRDFGALDGTARVLGANLAWKRRRSGHPGVCLNSHDSVIRVPRFRLL
jgi:hypothetical protein